MTDKLTELERNIKILQERQFKFEEETNREFKRIRIVINENQKQIDEILDEYDETIEGIHYRTDGLYMKLKETKNNLLQLQESFCNLENDSDNSKSTVNTNGAMMTSNNYLQVHDDCETETEFYSESQSQNDNTFDQ